jgi:hypothetical protein
MACKIISPVDLTAKISVLYPKSFSFSGQCGLAKAQVRYREVPILSFFYIFIFPNH